MSIIAPHMAEVVDLHREPITTPPSPYARELRFRAYPTQPPFGDQLAYISWTVESQLSSLWDQLLDPAWALDLFAPEIGTIRATDLLDALFDAADVAADEEMNGPTVRAQVAAEAYGDALDTLARAVRTAAEVHEPEDGSCGCGNVRDCAECMAVAR